MSKRIYLLLSSLTMFAGNFASAMPLSPAPVAPDYVLMVSVKVKAGTVANFKDALLPYAERTRGESGNLGYQIYQSPEDATEFQIVEHWRSDQGRADHVSAPYTQGFFAKAEPYFEAGFPSRKKFVELR